MHKKSFVVLAAILVVAAARAEIKVVVGYNDNDAASPAFKFQTVPPTSANNAATSAIFTIVDGEVDPNSGGVDKLNDGKLPEEADEPAENFFFADGSAGGRIQVDLKSVTEIRKVNSYSWHPNTRGPQVYKLYAADGTATNFNAAPKNGIPPESCGWTIIANVNTKPKSAGGGGQYCASIANSGGILGKYRYLLFDIATTERDDDFGNTFYSEINVVDVRAPVTTNGPADIPKDFTIKTDDGHCTITINTVKAPQLKDWAETKLAPVLAEWYPKISAMLASDGYVPPDHFKLTLKPMDGVAFTSGHNVVANSDWLEKELNGEAIGSLVHEEVHVVQQFKGNNPGWLVEGSADYIRWFKYDADKHGADMVWFRKRGKDFSPKYNDSYRITANFLNWVSEKYDPDIVCQLNAAMREGKYDDDLWKQFTGHALQDLGAAWKQEVMALIATPGK
ncbi:MAG TPA: basic secretory protein-like protein [Candidatus Sulfotelmatobacter sp.]|jgi:hypothetical protein|nr:basic secretory protein-like protein [Candidatus Sulfotelmatobacter sp.]